MIAQTLKDLRTRRKISQQRVANYLQVAKSTYANWEYGVAEPSASMLKKIATLHKITVDQLLVSV